MKRVSIKIAGAAGEGIKTPGVIIAKALKRCGYYTFGYTEYPSLVKGGHNTFQVDISDEKISSSKSRTDILLSLNIKSLKKELQNVEDNGIIFYAGKEQDLAKESLDNFDIKCVDTSKIAESAGGTKIMQNTAILGFLFGALGVSLDVVKEIFKEFFGGNPELLEKNIKVLEAGNKAYEDSGYKKINLNFNQSEDSKNQIVVTGNEALALSAIASGVRMFSAYPMTPATSILTMLAKFGPKYGMQINQMDDEIAVIQTCLAANFAGTRALCATSGGGMALMSETLGFAGLSETPLVMIDASRSGPATGIPTWHAQDDIRAAVGNTPSDIPKVVVAPGDAKECFEDLKDALDISEVYQIPVILITDKFMAETNYCEDLDGFCVKEINRGKLEHGEVEEGFKRFDVSNNVSRRTYPGVKNGYFVASSDEHDEYGRSIDYDPIRNKMMEKRMGKLNLIERELRDPKFYGDDSADISIISHGSNKGPILDAIRELRRNGAKVNFMHVEYVFPLKKGPVMEFLSNAKKSILIEANYSGQFGEVIRQKTLMDVDEKILRYDGRPFFVDELVKKLEVLL